MCVLRIRFATPFLFSIRFSFSKGARTSQSTINKIEVHTQIIVRMYRKPSMNKAHLGKRMEKKKTLKVKRYKYKGKQNVNINQKILLFISLISLKDSKVIDSCIFHLFLWLGISLWLIFILARLVYLSQD